MGYWLVIHVLEGGEEHFVESKEYSSYSGIELIKVSFIKRFAN